MKFDYSSLREFPRFIVSVYISVFVIGIFIKSIDDRVILAAGNLFLIVAHLIYFLIRKRNSNILINYIILFCWSISFFIFVHYFMYSNNSDFPIFVNNILSKYNYVLDNYLGTMGTINFVLFLTCVHIFVVAFAIILTILLIFCPSKSRKEKGASWCRNGNTIRKTG